MIRKTLIGLAALLYVSIPVTTQVIMTRGGEEDQPQWVSPPPTQDNSPAFLQALSAVNWPPVLVATPTPVPTPTPLPLPVVQNTLVVAAEAIPSGVERWRSLVASIFDADDVDGVLRIMTCESGGDPNAEGIGGRGLMQINPYVHGDYEAWRDPVTNLQKAYALSRGGTQWWPWDGPTPGRGQAWYDGMPCSGY